MNDDWSEPTLVLIGNFEGDGNPEVSVFPTRDIAESMVQASQSPLHVPPGLPYDPSVLHYEIFPLADDAEVERTVRAALSCGRRR